MSDKDEPLAKFLERLKESPLFGSLSEQGLAFLGTRAKKIHYPAGTILFWEGEPSQGLYWLQSGTLKAIKYSTAGREQILHLIESGHTFNEVGALSNLPNPASVAALVSAQVWHIPGETIRQLVRQESDFAQSIIEALSKRLRHSAALIEDLSLRPVISRLSRLILDEADGDTLLRPSWYTQDELAARLGTVTDVIQRSLRKLEADNLLEVGRHRILIIDRDALQQLAA